MRLDVYVMFFLVKIENIKEPILTFMEGEMSKDVMKEAERATNF